MINMQTIPFLKMHGCGNDYVYLDAISNAPPDDLPRLAVIVSDRHRSIGGDGLVVMLPSTNTNAAARMRMFNADGSEGSLCGNALRCMALWLYQTHRAGRSFRIEMGPRLIDVTIIASDEAAGSGVVRVRIGQPIVLSPNDASRSRFVRCISSDDLTLADGKEDLAILPSLIADVRHVSMGNPHTILFVPSLDACDVTGLGPRLECHSMFPDRTNVEFTEVVGPSNLRVRVWERGSGETLACGSGACAVAVAAIQAGLVTADNDDGAVGIEMTGGDLKVLWHNDDTVSLEGPAQIAFEGSLKRPAS